MLFEPVRLLFQITIVRHSQHTIVIIIDVNYYYLDLNLASNYLVVVIVCTNSPIKAPSKLT